MIGASFENDDPRRPERRSATDQRDRARFVVLAELGATLVASDDHVAIVRELGDLVVPALADWYSVHLSGADARLACVARSPREADRAAEHIAAAAAARVASTMRSEHAPRLLAVPLVVRGAAHGAIVIARLPAAGELDHDDLLFTEELGRRVVMYLDNALLMREVQVRDAALRDEAARLETLNRIGQQLAATHDLDEVVQRVCDAATALTGAEVGLAFAHVDGATRHATCGTTPEEHAAIGAARDELSSTSGAFAVHRVVRIADVRRTSRPPSLGALASVARVCSYLAVPVRGRRGDVIGGIALGHSQVDAFDQRAEQLVAGLASLSATATDSARLFHEARELIVALEHTNRELDQFAYVASHDLRAPLRGIANLATWIEEDLGERATGKALAYLQLLRGRVQRLEDLIQGVLAYSRAGRAGEAPQDVDIGALVREIVELLAPDERVVVAMTAPLPTVHCARVPLQQVLMNLIGNAIKHGGRDGLRVEVGAEQRGQAWEIFVRDTGPGIAHCHHEQIWELFHKLASRDRVDGAGIGLAIVRKIVEAHGGRAWVESDEGRGATFRFTWPGCAPAHRSWR